MLSRHAAATPSFFAAFLLLFALPALSISTGHYAIYWPPAPHAGFSAAMLGDITPRRQTPLRHFRLGGF